jgi:uncharacterized protein YdeI (YjbR/CyaY-like superfamily)
MTDTALPHDLQIALHEDPEADAAFAAMPFSHRREYIDWILEARRAETRASRIDKALAMMKEKARGG